MFESNYSYYSRDYSSIRSAPRPLIWFVQPVEAFNFCGRRVPQNVAAITNSDRMLR